MSFDLQRRNNQRQRVEGIQRRATMILAYLAEHPASKRRAIIDATTPKRNRTLSGEALAMLVKRREVVTLPSPEGGTVYVLKQDRSRVRWTPTTNGGAS